MPTAPYPEGNLSIWRGQDVLSFIDGLSTNHVLDLKKGEFRQTTFTTALAKVIDRVGLFHMGEFIAMLSHEPFWHDLSHHIMPRILGQDVNISLATSNNNFYTQYQAPGPEPGRFESDNGVTVARTQEGLNLVVAGKNVPVKTDATLEEFHQWRIETINPWPSFEITKENHAFACGLDADVHQSKGCYIGQELLTRMRTRGQTGKKLVVVSNDEEINGKITTKGLSKSLAIVRT